MASIGIEYSMHNVNKREKSSKEKYYNIRRAIIILGIFLILLLLSALYLGMVSARQMKEIIHGDFNSQQLVLARYAAHRIEDSLNFINRELTLLRFSPSIQYLEVSWASRMNTTLSGIKDDGVIDIRLIDKKGETAYLVDSLGTSRIIKGDFQYTEYYKWALKKENKNKIYIGEIKKDNEQYSGKLVMNLATPIYEESIDEAHPMPTGRFSGVLLLTVDATHLVRNVVKDIKSGKTGYAWAIDNKGVFIYHPKKEFIGEDSFNARAMLNPEISYDKINMIQKENMLKGREGTGWYISGSYGNTETEMKKLIAYAPVYLMQGKGNIWSIAVVAPMSEVEGPIHFIYIRQFYIQGVIIFVIVLGSIYVINFERRWARTLEEEVTKKTEDLKKSLEKLEKSEEKYRTLVESAEDLIYTIDEKGNYLSMNRYAARFFGGNSEDLVGKNIYDFFSNESAELQMGFIRQVFNTGKNVNVKYLVKVGEKEYWLTSNFAGIKNENDKTFAVLGISRDITERKKIEDEQMYNTEKLASLGKLTATVAHEINNPLSIILGFTDSLLEKVEAGTKEYEILKVVERQGINCKKIVENLLGFARYRDKTEYCADVNECLDNVISVVENLLVSKKINTDINITEDLPRVRGDSGHLQQVFMNLITNAVSAMDGGGVLTISTRLNEHDKMVEIIFKDTGHGIKKEFRDKIFDPFFTTKKVGEGTGLGLSVCKGIVTRYGGELTFETISEEEDKERKGTTFTVSLPIVPLEVEKCYGQT
ncbi:MAG: PAS domain S-box protein [Nitrospirae bacterium]|nr:PAS domain S-box protein [Nitrospirota bacterium]